MTENNRLHQLNTKDLQDSLQGGWLSLNDKFKHYSKGWPDVTLGDCKRIWKSLLKVELILKDRR